MLHPRDLALSLAAALLAAPSSLAAQVWEVGNHLFVLPPVAQQPFSGYGSALAVGDVDDDGLDDVVVGAPFVDYPTGHNGGIFLYRGTADRSRPGDVPRTFGGGGQHRGLALAIGNFDGTGRPEIAVGDPGTHILHNGTYRANAGAVSIWSFQGALSLVGELTQAGAQYTSPEEDDWFGWRLAAGDFDGDGYDDLAVGVPFEDTQPSDAGCVNVFYGGPTGLDPDFAQTFAIGFPLQGSPRAGDWFGLALAAGDFDDDGRDDLAVGVPYRDEPLQVDNAGLVVVLPGSPLGLTAVGSLWLTELHFGSLGQANARFGAALAAGRFDDPPFLCPLYPCYADLAIGVPGRTIATTPEAGRVWVAYGSANGITAAGATHLSQLELSVADPSPGDELGRTLAAGRLDPGFLSPMDLVVSTPLEGNVYAEDGGLIHLVFGDAGGIHSGAPDQPVEQRRGFAVFPPHDFDQWGDTTAVGDLDGDGWGDLVVGVPAKEHNGLTNAGVVQVLYGAFFADGFESSSYNAWATVVPN